jgi:hypothetical protein
MRRRQSLRVALLCAPLFTMAGASAFTEESAHSGPVEPEDRVIVAARKEKLSQLVRDIAKSEDAFFEAYNHVNTVPEYNVHCTVETSLGTHISHRECTPQFVNTAREDGSMNIIASLAEDVPTPAHGQTSNQVINDKTADYKKHLVAVVSQDPKLLKMLHDYDALKKQYETLRHEKIKGKAIYLGD